MLSHELDGEQRPRIVRALLALAVVLAFGTCGFMIIQDEWGFWRSIYFTVITITTVGYGDYGLNPTGERFTAVLLVFGIVTATYAVGQVVQAAVGYQLAWRRKMQKHIDRLDDHFIVCGIGRVGRMVCRRLSEASIPFVVIEKDDDRFESARSSGYLAIHGGASEDAVLLRAGIERARGIVCAVDSDSENIVITLSARELNPKTLIVSRAEAEDVVPKIRRAGASHVVSPSLRGGEDIANLLTRPHLTEFIEQSRRANSGYKLGEVTVDANSSLVGRTLREYGAKERSVAFLAVKHADGTTRIRPDADEAFRPGDVVIVVGEPEGVYRMSSEAEPAPACV